MASPKFVRLGAAANRCLHRAANLDGVDLDAEAAVVGCLFSRSHFRSREKFSWYSSDEDVRAAPERTQATLGRAAANGVAVGQGHDPGHNS